MNKTLQQSIACASFLTAIYAIYTSGTYLATRTFPDGMLFGWVCTILGAIFGYTLKAKIKE